MRQAKPQKTAAEIALKTLYEMCDNMAMQTLE